MKKKNDRGVPVRKASPSGSTLQSSAKKRKDLRSDPSRKEMLTKAQRHEIYKRALVAFDHQPYYLCFVLLDAGGIPGPSQVAQRAFPELVRCKPETAGFAWWKRNKQGHAARRKVLLQMIRMTAPALAARRKATKEPVPAPRGTGAKRSPKGSGASRARWMEFSEA